MSPAVNESYYSSTTSVYLDNYQKTLTPFEYHSDPYFDKLSKTVITENSMIIITVSILKLAEFHFNLWASCKEFSALSVLQGHGFSKAMTEKEAQAFVGDVQCNVNTLQDDKLFLDPPSTTPSARSKRHKRDTSADTLDLVVRYLHPSSYSDLYLFSSLPSFIHLYISIHPFQQPFIS